MEGVARNAQGRFVAKQREPVQKQAECSNGAGVPRPAVGRLDVQKSLTAAMPQVLGILLEYAQKGSVPHLKLLLMLCGMDRGSLAAERTMPDRSVGLMLLETWGREKGLLPEEDAQEQRTEAGQTVRGSVDVYGGDAERETGLQEEVLWR